MHFKRVISAVIFLPLIYFYLSKLPSPYFAILLALVCALAQYEFNSMYKLATLPSFLSIACGVVIVSAYYLQAAYHFDVTVLAITVLVISTTLWRLFAISNTSMALRDIAPAIVGLVYIPVLLSYQWKLYALGFEWILFLYGTVWASDSLAYYIGKSIGKRKLYESVSPNKTLEGAYASAVGGVIGAVILGTLMLKSEGMVFLVIAGFVIGVVTIFGDLVESMFKRDAGIKDSGCLIPGHGGFLDKIDGALFAGPALVCIKALV